LTAATWLSSASNHMSSTPSPKRSKPNKYKAPYIVLMSVFGTLISCWCIWQSWQLWLRWRQRQPGEQYQCLRALRSRTSASRSSLEENIERRPALRQIKRIIAALRVIPLWVASLWGSGKERIRATRRSRKSRNRSRSKNPSCSTSRERTSFGIAS
jgi:hypothetical protein